MAGTSWALAHLTKANATPMGPAMKAFHAILTALLMLFVAVMVMFRVVDGSFQSAGARMDRMLGAAATEATSLAEQVAETTDSAVQDVARDIAERHDER